jgi:hypothetical protein
MFGASLFQGESDDSTGMDASPDAEFSSTNPNGFYQQPGDQYGFSSTNPNGDPGQSIDPAEQAGFNASRAADSISNQSKSAVSESAMIGKSTGLASGFHSIFNPTAARVRRYQRILSRNQAKYAINQAKRAKDQYVEDSQIQLQSLQQSYVGRGLGESSIYNEGMQYYKDTMARKMATYDENITIAQNSARLVNSQIKDSYAQPYISLVNSVASMF